MLISFRKGAVALAAAATFMGSVAQAEVHSVSIMDGGFFPPTVFLQPGDQIEFINQSDATQIITGADDAWTSGEMGLDASFTIDVTEEMPQTFVSVIVEGEADAGEGDGDADISNEGALELHGEFTFEPAPI